MLDLQFGGVEFKSHPDHKSRMSMLLNSRLVCLWPVGILNPVIFDLNNIICFSHLLSPTSISVVNAAGGK